MLLVKMGIDRASCFWSAVYYVCFDHHNVAIIALPKRSGEGATQIISLSGAYKDQLWMNEWTDERMNKWMNDWMDEWMNGWMKAWFNGWGHKLIKYQINDGYSSSSDYSCKINETVIFTITYYVNFSSSSPTEKRENNDSPLSSPGRPFDVESIKVWTISLPFLLDFPVAEVKYRITPWIKFLWWSAWSRWSHKWLITLFTISVLILSYHIPDPIFFPCCSFCW